MSAAEKKSIVLFDGQCNFCNESVLFIIDRDPDEHFSFAPLQSDVGQKLLREHGITEVLPETLVLVQNERVSMRSTAALRIALGMWRLWPLIGLLGFLVPRFLRDAAYRAFAKRRYRWFGKTEACRVPTPELRRRFLALS
jgi:predicted DCC family thiol-disulfide oxidoreductase YuxK